MATLPRMRTRLLLLSALSFASVCHAGAGKPATAPSLDPSHAAVGDDPGVPISGVTTEGADAAINSAVDRLGSDDLTSRQSAETFLISQGKTALAALRTAASDPRPEVQLRARRALRTDALFRLPDVPDEVFSIAQSYLAGRDFDHRKPQLNRLFQIQPQPNSVMTRLIALETDDDLRRQMLYQLATGYRQAVPQMLLPDDDLPGVLNVLDGSAGMWGGAEAADDATALLLSNRLQEQIDILSAEQINGDTVSQERAAGQLCFLYRVSGKYDQAMKYARLSHDPSLIFLVLQDQGDWSAAAAEPDPRWRDPLAAAGYRAAFLRMAGHPDAETALLSPLSANAPMDADASFSTSRIFLLDDLPERGIELLIQQHPAVAFQMRVERGEIADAIDIAQRYENNPRDAAELGPLHDQLRQSLGELPEPATQSDSAEEPALSSDDKVWAIALDDLKDKKYQTAADAFGQMWNKDQTHFSWLYLHGYALKLAGKAELGQPLMDNAVMMPLGDPLARWKFAAELAAAGLGDIAAQQQQLGLRGGGTFDEVGFSEIYNTQAAGAIQQKQWVSAAETLDRLCLINLSDSVQWHDSVRLLTIPALAHLIKARDALTRRDLTATMAELQSYLQYLPASSDMVLEMVPALDQLGEHEKADEIFESVYQHLSTICGSYPKSVTYLNELAWMSACCNRRLDEALKAAQTTVQLQPNNWQVLDTLAEVRFRRGDRPAAIDLEKRAMLLASDPYLVKQLKRFQTAEVPSTTQPVPAPE